LIELSLSDFFCTLLTSALTFTIVLRRNGANIGLGFFQDFFHLVNLYLPRVKDHGIDFTIVPHTLVYPYDAISPIQGVFADIVSADDKRRFL